MEKKPIPINFVYDPEVKDCVDSGLFGISVEGDKAYALIS